ncbi:MAG: PDGLE domain-containing protein [Methanobacteriaceae archaeon]|nr:PDGLE domain-containing protein [Methanobacteriaceae archaeon]
MELNKFYVIGLAIALVICVLSPFLASGNPDGLEASAEVLNPFSLESEPLLSVIMPDYTFEGMEDNPLAGVVSLLIGAVVTVALAGGVFYIVTKK